VPISFDPEKRNWTLAVRGLDFAEAAELIEDGASFEFVDDRRDYGETRITTIGLLRGRMIVVIWTKRDDDHHVISMRKANDREYARYASRLG
jgi:hypothetical protein